MIDTRVPGWQTSAWMARNDGFCVRAAEINSPREAGSDKEFVSCVGVPGLDEIGPPLLPAKPLPWIAPLDPQQEDILLVGAVRGPVATVSVTMFDQTSTTAVRPLPATGGRQIGAYAAWLPRSGPQSNGMRQSDISLVIGRDAAGTIVARIR